MSSSRCFSLLSGSAFLRLLLLLPISLLPSGSTASPHSVAAVQARPPHSSGSPAHPASAHPASTQPASTPLTSTEPLEARLAAIAREADGTVGLSALHLESGRRVALRGDEPFPMQSVYKLPIGLAVLQMADEGKLTLERTLRIAASDLRLGVSPLAERWKAPGIDVTIGELLSLMVSRSDNSASDRLLALAGGGAAVTARVRALGVEGLRVDRSEGELGRDVGGLQLPPASEWTLDLLRARWAETPESTKRAAMAAYLTDPRDTSTPDAATALIARILRGDVLKPASTDLLLRLLIETPTTPKRMRGALPADVIVGHKSGTSGSDMDGGTLVVNDVGFLTLPHDRGRIVLSIFVKGSRKPVDRVEPVIARLARTILDEWAAEPAASPATPAAPPR